MPLCVQLSYTSRDVQLSLPADIVALGMYVCVFHGRPAHTYMLTGKLWRTSGQVHVCMSWCAGHRWYMERSANDDVQEDNGKHNA